METKVTNVKKSRNSASKLFRKLTASIFSIFCMMQLSLCQAFAFDNVSTVTTNGADASKGMAGVIGVLLTITRYAGVGLLIFGVYEIVMSFMQNQPEAKTKGIIMALCGVVMISLKTVISAFGVTIA
jgi:lantibiotic modifying enzyme